MTPLAVGLVLASALAHASWNLLAKNASSSRVFTWLCAVSSTLVAAPLSLIQISVTGSWPTPESLVFPVASGLIQVVYFITLTRAYRAGDLSLVYPLARGSGPLMAIAISVVAL